MCDNSTFVDGGPCRTDWPKHQWPILYLSRPSFHLFSTFTLCARLSEIICSSLHGHSSSLFFHMCFFLLGSLFTCSLQFYFNSSFKTQSLSTTPFIHPSIHSPTSTPPCHAFIYLPSDNIIWVPSMCLDLFWVYRDISLSWISINLIS